MSDLLLLAATLYMCNFALLSHHGRLYARRGRAMWKVTTIEVAATALPKRLWGEA